MDPISGRHRVIAAQCPIPSTFSDFKDMVKQENVKRIIMVTNFVEGGKPKCDQYINLVDRNVMSNNGYIFDTYYYHALNDNKKT
jgi:protein tyrosine phosphatase